MRGTPAIYFQSLNRPFLIMGVMREYFYANMALAIFIAYSAEFAWKADSVAVVMGMLGHALGIIITRIDPQIMTIIKRHMHYKRYYAPVAGLHAKERMVYASVPVYQGKRGLV